MIFNMVGGGGSNIDLSGVTAAAGDVRATKVFVDSNGNEVTGTLTDWSGAGGVTIDISNTDAVTIPAGIHSETTVRISETERNKIIASNIKNGVTILGVTGNLQTGYTINGTERVINTIGTSFTVGQFVYVYQAVGTWQIESVSSSGGAGTGRYPAVVIETTSDSVTVIAYS